jgi:preprotein translocase subunit SecE
MSRAIRRHPASKGARGPRGKAARPLPRTGGGRATTRAEGRSGFTFWRPRFIVDIISELRKVVWPSRQDAFHLTVVVIFVAALVGAVLGGIDIGFGWLIDNTLLR